MTHISYDSTHTDDDRWLEAGPVAFALHYSTMAYSDRQGTDGYISRPMALRVALAVPPADAPAAIEALVTHGFWAAEGSGYRVQKFHDHAIPAAQQARTRARWREDKERRRQHGVGDHSLCKDEKFCPAIRGDSTVDSTGGGSPLYPTQLNQTQPNPTRPKEEGWSGGVERDSAGATSAQPPGGEKRPLPLTRHRWSKNCCPLPTAHPVHLAEDGYPLHDHAGDPCAARAVGAESDCGKEPDHPRHHVGKPLPPVERVVVVE